MRKNPEWDHVTGERLPSQPFPETRGNGNRKHAAHGRRGRFDDCGILSTSAIDAGDVSLSPPLVMDDFRGPSRRTYIGTHPTLRSQQRDDVCADYDISVWRSDRNLCECQSSSPCDTIAGVYYGSREDEVTKFCPKHFYELHCGQGAPYRLRSVSPTGEVSRA